MSTLDDVMAALDLEEIPVEGFHPDLDGKLVGCTLSAVEGLPLSARLEKLDSDDASRPEIYAELIVHSIRNGDGSLVFTPEHAAELPTKHGARFWALARAAGRANGMWGTADEETAKNSPEPAGDDAGT